MRHRWLGQRRARRGRVHGGMGAGSDAHWDRMSSSIHLDYNFGSVAGACLPAGFQEAAVPWKTSGNIDLCTLAGEWATEQLSADFFGVCPQRGGKTPKK